MVREGFTPNRLPIYGAKQMLSWTTSAGGVRPRRLPERQVLRRRRDPNGYAGIAWAIGGRHDRPFPPNKPIIGLVRLMGMRAMKRYFDTETYVRQIEERDPR